MSQCGTHDFGGAKVSPLRLLRLRHSLDFHATAGVRKAAVENTHSPGTSHQAPIESVAKRLEGPQGAAKDNGEVALVLMLGEGTEVEVKLPGRFKVSPQIAGAIKAVPGVIAVEAV